MNDTKKAEIIVLHIPASSLHLQSAQGKGLKVRTDKPTLLEVRVDVDTLFETNSNTDLSGFLLDRIKY